MIDVDKELKWMFVAWAVYAVCVGLLFSGLIYIALHFIGKLW